MHRVSGQVLLSLHQPTQPLSPHCCPPVNTLLQDICPSPEQSVVIQVERVREVIAIGVTDKCPYSPVLYQPAVMFCLIIQ